MKKQILLIATLAGALFLGSCVDDKESASVTAVREAKAEQLKGLAALAQAQAQAATMAAEADAALKQAQAAYFEAQAAYEQARTEEAKANAQKAMAEAQAEIQRIAAQLEIDLLDLKAKALQAQADYEKALLNASTQNLAELTGLYNTYKTYASQLLTAQQNLAKAKVLLQKYQAQVIDNAQFRQEQIAEKNDLIAQYQSEIDAANAALEMYKKYNTNTPESQEAYKNAEAAAEEANQVYQTSMVAYSAAINAENKARQTLTGSAYFKAYSDFINTRPSFNDVSIMDIYDWSVGDNGRPVPYAGTVGASYYSEESKKDVYIPLFYRWPKAEDHTIEYTYGEGLPVQTQYYFTYTDYYYPIDGGLDAYSKVLNESLAANQTKAVTDCTAAFNKAKAAYETAKKAYEDAAAADKEAKKVEMDAKEVLMNDADRALAQAERDEEQAKDQLESILSLVETMKSQLANHKANVEARNAAQKDVAEAVVAQNIACNALTVKNNEADALWNVIYGNDVTGQISSLEASIEANENAIKNLKEEIFDLENSTDDADLIASQEATITELEAEIAVLEKQAAAAKAALEAAINAGKE